MQRAQTGGVGRRQVDGDVARAVVDLAQAVQVIIHGVLYRGYRVLADIDAQYALVAHAIETLQHGIHALVVETEAVNDGQLFGQTKQTRFGVARLRARGNGTHFNGAEPHGGQTIHGNRILVQTCRQPHRVVEGQPHDLHRLRRHPAHQLVGKAQAAGSTNHVQCEVVGGFCGQAKHQRAKQIVHGGIRSRKIRLQSIPDQSARRSSLISLPSSVNCSTKLPYTP